jgi:hypothetical protein
MLITPMDNNSTKTIMSYTNSCLLAIYKIARREDQDQSHMIAKREDQDQSNKMIRRKA